jgi:hypothetical protein
MAAAFDIAALIGPDLGWDDDEQRRQVETFRAAVEHERDAAELPDIALDAALGA